MISMLLQFLKFALIIASPLLVILLIMFIFFICFFMYYFIFQGKRVKPSTSTYKNPSIFKRLFWDFPDQLAQDLFNRDPDEFREYGLHMFCGEQGSGKTTAIVHLLLMLKEKYPKVKVRTNMNYLHQDGEINHWQELVKNENGEYGQVEVLDEIQTWFSSNQSKNFPPEMITEISQQRKQRKMLVGSAQVFSRIAKPIREQTTFVYLPFTIAGCLTIVRVSKPEFWDDEEQKFKRYLRTYFFVHNKKVREAFDTYKKIEKYQETGFQEINPVRVMDKD
ncbi:ATP-binding protein [Tissierella sp.]|uniref:ATP-binding protein n=1 Tax=Tissierella sp. TaxID=41274 RepID=UPI0030362FA8